MGYAPQMQMQAPASYEFNDAENGAIANTAKFARIWGWISLVSGVLLLLMSLLVIFAIAALLASMHSSGSMPSTLSTAKITALGLSLLPSSIVSILGGIFYISSGSSLQRVVTTQGSDIPLLMDAMKSLSRAFMIEAIALIVSFVFGLVIGLMNLGGTS